MTFQRIVIEPSRSGSGFDLILRRAGSMLPGDGRRFHHRTELAKEELLGVLASALYSDQLQFREELAMRDHFASMDVREAIDEVERTI